MLTRLRQLFGKAEVTPGTAIALLVGDAGYRASETIFNPGGDWESVPNEGFGSFTGRPGPMIGTVSFKIDMSGSGVGGSPVPEWATVFLSGCGLLDTANVFTIDEGGSNTDTLTIAGYQDGLIKKLRGCRGNAVFVFVAGKLCWIEFEFTGIWVTPTDDAMLAPTYDTVIPPKWSVTDGFKVGPTGSLVAQQAQECRLNLGNSIKVIEDPNDAGGSGLAYAEITNAEPVLSYNPTAKLVATDPRYTQWEAGTSLEAAIILGSVAGNKITVDAGDTQVMAAAEGDRDGIVIDDIELQINNSDLQIEFIST